MYQRIILAALLLQAGIVIAAAATPSGDFRNKQYEVTVERNVAYGQGDIGGPGQVRSRPVLGEFPIRPQLVAQIIHDSGFPSRID